MFTTNERPKWACTEWGRRDHDWLSCQECLAEYENLIESAQDAEEEEVAAHHSDA